jgi:putative DNA primase/helicase
VEKGEGHRHTLETIAALRSDEDLYHRNHQLVHIVGAPEPKEGERALVAGGTPTVRPMALATLWERASRAALWLKWDGRVEGLVRSDPAGPVLAAVLARGEYPGLRELTGILESPFLRPDGTLAFGSGWDDATGFLLCPSEDFIPPPARPTQEDGAAALAELREVFEDFPHVTESSRMVPVSGILTMLARPAIMGAIPAIAFDASTRGSGKTRQADAVSLVTLGRILPPLSYPAEVEELEKIMGALAIAGVAATKFDNVDVRFGGGPIDRVLTAADTTTFRILGKSETPELRWRALIMVTGNNLELRGDTARRMLVSRLESPLENPEERDESTFKHPDLLGWVKQNRVRLVRAGLTVLRGWECAGRPRSGTRADGSTWAVKTWGGGFEAWSAIIPAAIMWAGGADPMASRPAMTGDEEPEKAALAVILAGLERLDAAGAGLTTKAIVDFLYTRDRLRGEAAPDGYDDLREAIESLVPVRAGQPPQAKPLGEKMAYLGKGRVVGGRKLVRYRASGNVSKWKVERV